MKVKLVLACLAVAGLAVSSAVAAPPEGKGKPKTGEGCKPRISVILKGTIKTLGNPLTVDVTSANKWGKPYVGTGKSIATTPDTKVRGQGMKQLGQLKPGFRVLIQARVCKADLAAGKTPPPLTATKIIAHDPSKADKDDEDDKDDDD